jgi:hypothetical protein
VHVELFDTAKRLADRQLLEVRPEFDGLVAFVLVVGGALEGCFPYIPRFRLVR